MNERMTEWLTHPVGRVLYENLILVIKIPRISGNQKVRYCVHKSLPSVRILSHTNPVRVLPSCFFKVHFNVTRPWGVPTRTLYELPPVSVSHSAPITSSLIWSAEHYVVRSIILKLLIPLAISVKTECFYDFSLFGLTVFCTFRNNTVKWRNVNVLNWWFYYCGCFVDNMVYFKELFLFL